MTVSSAHRILSNALRNIHKNTSVIDLRFYNSNKYNVSNCLKVRSVKLCTCFEGALYCILQCSI